MSGNDAALSAEDSRLFDAIERNAAEAVQQAIRYGANVNVICYDNANSIRGDWTPLIVACRRRHGIYQIVRTLLDAGADARWQNKYGWSAIMQACWSGHLSTVQLFINHDTRLLGMVDVEGYTPLVCAVLQQHYDVVRFLLERGADPHGVDQYGITALMYASKDDSLEIVRLLLAASVDVEARDCDQKTALHYAAYRGHIEVVRQLILQHNANMFAVDKYGRTPFDEACNSRRSGGAVHPLLEMYGNKLTQDHGRLALHAIVRAMEYPFAQDEDFHPPLNPSRIILPLGRLTWKHLRTLLHTLDPELIRTRDDTGKLPIHIACQTNAPLEVLALILELDPTSLHIADSTGALPIHLLCGTTGATEYASVRHLVDQGGVGTLAARNRQGALPLHVLCGSANPPLRAVQFLMQSFPGSVAAQTNTGQYPLMIAACETSTASLSVVYVLARANPGLIVPR